MYIRVPQCRSSRANPAKPFPLAMFEVDVDLNPAQPGPPGGD